MNTTIWVLTMALWTDSGTVPDGSPKEFQTMEACMIAANQYIDIPDTDGNYKTGKCTPREIIGE